ncbi:hypothetical protein Scep_015244 [Stephania cephalantha]|uniref:Uncharacterized protein n=1 Tax=Stephania cephalantha TaxID=152367 RepID=A0AAP0P175_9MAGN
MLPYREKDAVDSGVGFGLGKQVHPDIGISDKALGIMNSFINDIFEKLAGEASKLARSPPSPLARSRLPSRRRPRRSLSPPAPRSVDFGFIGLGFGILAEKTTEQRNHGAMEEKEGGDGAEGLRFEGFDIEDISFNREDNYLTEEDTMLDRSVGVGSQLQPQWVVMAREIPLPYLSFSLTTMEVRPSMATTPKFYEKNICGNVGRDFLRGFASKSAKWVI